MKKFSKLLTLAMIAGVGIFGSCKDCNEDMFQKLQAEIDKKAPASVDATIADLQKSINAINGSIATAQEMLQAYLPTLVTKPELADTAKNIRALLNDYAKASALQAAATKLETLGQDLEAAKEILANAIIAIQEDVTTNANAISAIKEDVSTNAEDIAKLNEAIKKLQELSGAMDAIKEIRTALGANDGESLENIRSLIETASTNAQMALNGLEELNGINEAIQAVKTTADAALGTANANAGRLDVIDGTLSDFESRIAALENAAPLSDVDKKYVDDLNKSTLKSIRTLKGELTKRIEELENYRPFDVGRIEALEAWKVEIDSLRALNGVCDDLRNDVNELFSRVSQIENLLEHQITSITNQGAFSKLFGYVATPFGTNNLILALYGENTNAGSNFEFPSANGTYELIAENALSPEDIAILKLATTTLETITIPDVILTEKGAAAGQVYFSVAPADANLGGTEFSIVNSLDDEVFTLDNVQPCNQLLTYGLTRGATVSETASNGLYSADVYLNADKLADYTIKVGGFATAVKEAFKALKNGEAINYSSLKSEIVKLIGESNKIEADAIKALWTDGAKYHPVYSKFEYGVAAIKPLAYNNNLLEGEFKLKDLFPALSLQELENEPLVYSNPDAQALADKLQSLINDINSNYVAKINDLVNRIYGSAIMNKGIKPASLIQPILLCAGDDNTPVMVSMDKNNPTKIIINSDYDEEEGVALVATSATTELIAPAFKKFIGITDVFSGTESAKAGTPALQEAALDANLMSDDLAVVVDGSQSVFSFKPHLVRDFAGSYIFEIVFSALDYSGQAITNKYYIEIAH